MICGGFVEDNPMHVLITREFVLSNMVDACVIFRVINHFCLLHMLV